jgi:hypothetical protein
MGSTDPLLGEGELLQGTTGNTHSAMGSTDPLLGDGELLQGTTGNTHSTMGSTDHSSGRGSYFRVPQVKPPLIYTATQHLGEYRSTPRGWGATSTYTCRA